MRIFERKFFHFCIFDIIILRVQGMSQTEMVKAMTATDQFCDFVEEHENHICQMVSKASVGEIIELVDLPGFICENCARVANRSEHLCRPKALD